MCNKAVDNYPHALVPECYKTQKKRCNKAVDRHPTNTKYVPECSKTREMCN